MDVPTEVLDHGFLAKAVDGHLLVHEVGDNVAWCRARHLDPYTGKESAGAHDEGRVEDHVEGVLDHIDPLTRGRDIVGEAADGGGVASHVVVLPLAQEANEEVALELAVKNLGEEVQVGDDSGLEDDGDVRGIEQLDGVRVRLASLALALELKFNAEALLDNKELVHEHTNKSGCCGSDFHERVGRT